MDNTKLVTLLVNLIRCSAEPDCGCEYQHISSCDAMRYRNAVEDIEAYIHELKRKEEFTKESQTTT